MAESTLCIGIDLGTTNCCACYCTKGTVEVLENKDGDRTTPSYVFFSGKNAILVGKYAKKRSSTKPEYSVYEVKRLMGRNFNDPHVQNNLKYFPFQIKNVSDKPVIVVSTAEKNYQNTPEELSGYILKKIKTDVEEKLGQTVTKAVITVPAYFNVSQREATLKAADKAGFTVLKLLNEPTAAALHYFYKNADEEDDSYSLVYDLGGGTFDVAVLRRTKNNINIVCVDGDSYLGGNDFDNLIMDYVNTTLSDLSPYDTDIDIRLLRRLKNKCEEAKKELSTVEETEIILEDGDVAIPLTRKQFEEMAGELFQKTIDIVDKCLKNSKLSKLDIKEIILSGGSTRIPRIQEMISNFFDGKKLNKFVNLDECVAHGAAIQAALLSTHPDQCINQITITDVIPLSIGTVVLGGYMVFIIKRNSSIPITRCHTFTNTVHTQTSMSFDIFEGERLEAKKNYYLDTFKISGLTSAPPGQCETILTMTIDQNGILIIKAKEKLSGNTKDLKIEYNRLQRSDNEIKSAIEDARQNEAEDQKFLTFATKKKNLMEYCNCILYNLDEKDLVEKHKDLYERCRNILKEVQAYGIEEERTVDKLTEEVTMTCLPLQKSFKYMPDASYDQVESTGSIDHSILESYQWNE